MSPVLRIRVICILMHTDFQVGQVTRQGATPKQIPTHIHTHVPYRVWKDGERRVTRSLVGRKLGSGNEVEERQAVRNGAHTHAHMWVTFLCPISSPHPTPNILYPALHLGRWLHSLHCPVSLLQLPTSQGHRQQAGGQRREVWVFIPSSFLHLAPSSHPPTSSNNTFPHFAPSERGAGASHPHYSEMP
jgi:hypothetical protein